MTNSKVISTNPNAAIVVYNYKDRAGAGGGAYGTQDLNSEIEPPIFIDKDIISITTVKYKSQPSGEFVINLAPTRNWMTTLSLSSWISIHISTSDIRKNELYSSKNLKMIGRINGIRLITQTDQETGLIYTSFEITGKDWGQIFESVLYIDSAVLMGHDNIFKELAQFSNRFELEPIFGKGLPNTTKMAEFLIAAWGRKSTALENQIFIKNQAETGGGLSVERFFPTYNVHLPKELASRLSIGETTAVTQYDNEVEKQKTLDKAVEDIHTGIKKGQSAEDIKARNDQFELDIEKYSKKETKSYNLADAVKIVTGKLVSDDKYEEANESLSLINFNDLINQNAIWQLLEANCNTVVNELVTDIKWTNSSSKPEFILYKRIKPFLLNSSSMKGVNSSTDPNANQYAERIKSPFFYLKKTSIGKENITKIDCGVNWESRINFIEIKPNIDLYMPYIKEEKLKEAMKVQMVSDLNSVTFDRSSFVREGIRSMIMSTDNAPVGNNGLPDVTGFKEWMPVIREWYFNSHKMLNGGITIVGNNEYIGVGENILIPASTIGHFPMVEGQIKDIENASLLAHVEAVSNVFSVGENGNKTYYRNINFIRGVITDKNGTKLLNSSSFAVDNVTTAIPDEAEKPLNVYGGGSSTL